MTQNLPKMPKAVNLLTGQRYLMLLLLKNSHQDKNDHLKWLRYAEGWRPDDWTGEIKIWKSEHGLSALQRNAFWIECTSHPGIIEQQPKGIITQCCRRKCSFRILFLNDLLIIFPLRIVSLATGVLCQQSCCAKYNKHS